MEKILPRIHKAGLKFLEPLTIAQTYILTIQEAVKLLDADCGYLYIADKNILQQIATYPKKSSVDLPLKKSGFQYKTYNEKKSFVIQKDELVEINLGTHNTVYTSAICIPLVDHEKSIGVVVVVVAKEKQELKQNELELLKMFGSYASLALRKAKLEEESKQALQARDFFISMAAHELRTPLTAVNGYIQLLNSKIKDTQTNETKWIKNLLWESQRLTLLINELLEVDRIKTGELTYKWSFHTIEDILERAINNLKFTFPQRTIIYKADLTQNTHTIVGDFDKILQALTNVLENAAKFSPANTEILLSLTSNKDAIIISIQDFGSGIPKEILPKLFEGYTVNRTNETQGMGIGMYLVKNILRLHKGKIIINTKENVGTTVQIFLPKSQ